MKQRGRTLFAQTFKTFLIADPSDQLTRDQRDHDIHAEQDTVVEIEDGATGAKETFTILGAWDGDLDKNIISYLSESAKVLIGKAVGEELDLPTDSHNVSRKVKITAIQAFKP